MPRSLPAQAPTFRELKETQRAAERIISFVDTRKLPNGGTCSIYKDAKSFFVEVTFGDVMTSRRFDSEAEAWHAWLHPFDRETRFTPK